MKLKLHTVGRLDVFDWTGQLFLFKTPPNKKQQIGTTKAPTQTTPAPENVF